VIPERGRHQEMKKINSILLLFLFAICAYGQTENPKESLRGLKGVYVNVVPVAENARKDGLSPERIHQVVTNQLRAAGINIHTQPQASDGYANLIVIVDTIKHPQGPYLFTVSVGVVQNVKLSRLTNASDLPAETYGKNALGLTTPGRMEVIEEPLKEKLAEFIADYFSVNPKNKT
jgi:hypothetical protein